MRGALRWRSGDWEGAEGLCRRAHEIGEQVGRSEVAFQALYWLSATLRDQGKYSDAEITLARALDICERAGLVAQSVEAISERAVCLALGGHAEQAREAAESAANLADRLHYPVGAAAAAEAGGITLADPKEGVGVLAEASAAWARLDLPIDAARCELMRARGWPRRTTPRRPPPRRRPASATRSSASPTRRSGRASWSPAETAAALAERRRYGCAPMPLLTRPDGIQIHYELRGESGPLVALFPWWSYIPGVYDEMLGDLESDHRILTYDMRGNGRSTRRGPTTSRRISATRRRCSRRSARRPWRSPSPTPTTVAPPSPPAGPTCSAPSPASVPGRSSLAAYRETDAMLSSLSVIEAVREQLARDQRGALRSTLAAGNPQQATRRIRGGSASRPPTARASRWSAGSTAGSASTSPRRPGRWARGSGC